jgi:hypothetical protein
LISTGHGRAKPFEASRRARMDLGPSEITEKRRNRGLRWRLSECPSKVGRRLIQRA